MKEEMDNLSTKSKLHSRLSNFVSWIAPDPETRDAIVKQSNEIRERIRAKAKDDNVTVTATPQSGSFAKRTGLRRHMRGEAEIEGQDIDVPFVVKLQGQSDYQLAPMITKFRQYADASYPDTEKKDTKSSVKLIFSNTLSYDLVPVFATDDPEKQILVRTTGEQITTSIQKHVDFVTDRTKKSDTKKGVVLFNECVRLMKWWRDVRCSEANYLEEVPSFLIDLLSAKAFDKLSVQTTYAQTLSEWSAYLAHVVRKKELVYFTDFDNHNPKVDATIWQVIDPVNRENNVAAKLQAYEIEELAGWFQEARESWSRAITADLNGDDIDSLDHLVTLFGNSFMNHCEE